MEDKIKVRSNRKIRDMVEEEFGDEERFEEMEKLEERLLPEKEVFEEKKGERKPLSERIQKGMEFLDSCVIPREGEEIKVVKTEIRQGHSRFSVEYPVVERNEETKLVDISYLADYLVRTVGGDFTLLKQSVNSKLLRKTIFERIGLKDDNDTRYFLERCFESSNSRDSLAMYLGYTLLVPQKIEKVEDTGNFDEKNGKVINVYSLDFRGIDPKIYGAGISILKHLGIRVKINACYG